MTTTAPARTDDGDQLGRWETDGGHLPEPTIEDRQAQTEHVGRQLIAVADRLCREFAPDGGAAAAAVRAQVRRSRAEFGSPRVIAYLPTLVERAVRRRLRPG
jgi:hypothetical protein